MEANQQNHISQQDVNPPSILSSSSSFSPDQSFEASFSSSRLISTLVLEDVHRSFNNDEAASSSRLISTLVIEELPELEEGLSDPNLQIGNNGDIPPRPRPQQEQQQRQQNSIYGISFSMSEAARREMKDDVWSCLVVLVTFWLFASITLILGLYGSVSLPLGPNSSRILKANPVFVQSIQVEKVFGQESGLIVYGLYKQPLMYLDVPWTETHNVSVPVDYHREWMFFLNENSQVNISYSVIYPKSSPLFLIIARGQEGLVDWIDDPSYPNATLSWNIVTGNGRVEQNITKSSNYYIALGNMNSDSVQVEINFTIKAVIYNTSEAYYKCLLDTRSCDLNLHFLGSDVAVVTSSHREENTIDADWYVRVSFGPRWATYIAGSGLMSLFVLLAIKICNKFHPNFETRPRYQPVFERAPLIVQKDDLWGGSSYESVSQDEDDLEERFFENSNEVKALKENPRRICLICFESPRDCFFLPCGHCAACFTCATRIADEAGKCPICRRRMKKVRKIFTV